MKGRHLLASVSLLMVLSACETEFVDDVEIGVVNPVYRFIVGDPSSVVEGRVCEDSDGLWSTNFVYVLRPGSTIST